MLLQKRLFQPSVIMACHFKSSKTCFLYNRACQQSFCCAGYGKIQRKKDVEREKELLDYEKKKRKTNKLEEEEEEEEEGGGRGGGGGGQTKKKKDYENIKKN